MAPPLPPITITEPQQKQGLAEQADKVLAQINKFRDARGYCYPEPQTDLGKALFTDAVKALAAGQPELAEARFKAVAEITGNAVAYYQLACFEFGRYEKAEEKEKGSGAQFIGNALVYLGKSLQADPDLAEAVYAKMLLHHGYLQPLEENTRIAVQAFETLRALLKDEEELGRKPPPLKLPQEEEEAPAPRKIKTRFKPMLAAACERIGVGTHSAQLHKFLCENKNAKFLPPEYIENLKKIFLASGMPVERIDKLTSLPHKDPNRDDTKETVEVAKKVIDSMLEELEKPKPPAAEPEAKKIGRPPKAKLSEKERAFKGAGIPPDHPSVIVVAKTIFGENLDQPIHRGQPILLGSVDSAVLEMLSFRLDIFDNMGKRFAAEKEKRAAEADNPPLVAMKDAEARKATRAYLRACRDIGYALLEIAPNCKELSPADRKSVAENIGGSLSIVLLRHHVEIISARKLSVQNPAIVPPAPVKVEAPRREEPRLTPEYCMRGLEMILLGKDGKRSLYDVLNRRYISTEPNYRNPFDNLLNHPEHAEKNAQRIAVVLEDRMKRMFGSTPVELTVANGLAAEQAAKDIIAKDVLLEYIEKTPALKAVIVEKLGSSLLDRYLGHEPIPFVRHDANVPGGMENNAARALPAPASAEAQRGQRARLRDELAEKLREQSKEMREGKTVTVKDIDRTISLIDTHKDVLGKSLTDKMKVHLVALKKAKPLTTWLEFGSTLRELALVVDQINKK